ncbi:MAG: peptidylprolyl isomerase, partial [Desulfobacteraceae bacterium]|nr:peptidylprolyl isomerase [Desulfobacteraceae bacterium]
AGYGLYVFASEKSTTKAAGQASTTTQAPAADTKASAPAKESSVIQPQANGPDAAKVNGIAIPKSEYDAEAAKFDRQVAMTGRSGDDKEIVAMRGKIIENLIGRELLRQEAQKQGLKPENEEVDAQIDSLKKRFGSEEEYQNTLKKMNVTEGTIKEQFAAEIVLRKLVEKDVASKITLGPNEAREFYDKNPEIFKTPESVRASHILVKVEENASPEERAKAQEKIKAIRKRIADGGGFAAIAKEVSDCPSKEQGGDLGFFQKGQMVGPFETAAFSLKVDELSDIVETEYGYHIIKVTGKKDAGVMAFEEMQPRIEQHVKGEKMAGQLVKYVDDLKSKAKVEIFVK